MKAMKKPIPVDYEFAVEDGEIETLEGIMSYKKGDAIITGIKGEKYACRRDIFDQTYSIVDEGHAEEPPKTKIMINRHDIGATALYVSIMFLVISVALRYTETGFVFIWAASILDIFAGYELGILKELNKGRVRQ
ncbi:MAG: PGDYG domain-containing protein [Thermoplasmata archaeon]|nr:PGDYG domain-containing protein [Candidatus Sysuiplasma jiujiangense]